MSSVLACRGPEGSAPAEARAAAVELRIALDPLRPLPGDTVAVRVETARTDARIGAFRLDVVFDPDSARFLGRDSLPPHVVVNEGPARDGRIRVAGARPEGVGRELFAGRFEVRGSAERPFAVEVLEAVDPDLQRLPVRRVEP
jgi:hypothetical protein